MKYIIETERLFLRELDQGDLSDLAEILCDPESMQYYPRPFDRSQVENWINWNIKNYKDHGHGLWAVVLKENHAFIGDCGITIQEIDGERLPELGYHIKEDFYPYYSPFSSYSTRFRLGWLEKTPGNLRRAFLFSVSAFNCSNNSK